MLIGADGQVRGVGTSGWDREQKHWRQFWVDADGVVRLYVGGPAPDGTFVLTSEPEPDGLRWRYTYRDIQPDTLNADYAWSKGQNADWSTVWSGHYTRRAASKSTSQR